MMMIIIISILNFSCDEIEVRSDSLQNLDEIVRRKLYGILPELKKIPERLIFRKSLHCAKRSRHNSDILRYHILLQYLVDEKIR